MMGATRQSERLFRPLHIALTRIGSRARQRRGTTNCWTCWFLRLGIALDTTPFGISMSVSCNPTPLFAGRSGKSTNGRCSCGGSSNRNTRPTKCWNIRPERPRMLLNVKNSSGRFAIRLSQITTFFAFVFTPSINVDVQIKKRIRSPLNARTIN